MALVLAALVAAAPGCKKDEAADDAGVVEVDIERFRVDLLPDDIARGGKHPLVTVVVFTDFSCPPCARTWKVMDHLRQDYGEDLKVVFRAYPVQGHQRGEAALEAAFAADGQGKFWEMHARLFEHGGTFDRPSLRAHAEAIGLDAQKLVDELDDGVHAARLARHRRQALALGVMAAPVSFVNGVPVIGFREEADWHAVLDEEIRRARKMIREGTARDKIYDAFMAGASTRPLRQSPEVEELRKQAPPTKAEEPPRHQPDRTVRYRVDPAPGSTPVFGEASAPVQVVEFVDFQCPFCRKAWDEGLSTMAKRYGKDLALHVRHYPLEIHPGAKAGARAAVAAEKQGKLRPFHDRLLKTDGELGRDSLAALARELGLDVPRFLADFDAPTTLGRLEDDLRLAARLGVTGTPGFFVNGFYVSGFDLPALTSAIDAERDKARKKRKEGVAAGAVRGALMADATTDLPND